MPNGGNPIGKVVHLIVFRLDYDFAVAPDKAPFIAVLHRSEVVVEEVDALVFRLDDVGALPIDHAPFALHADECDAAEEEGVVVILG